MKNKQTDKRDWPQFLLSLSMGLIVVIAAISMVFTLIAPDADIMRQLVARPIYYIPWLLLAGMLIVFILFQDTRIKRKGAFLFTHFSLIFLIFGVVLEMATSRTVFLALPEGGGFALSQLQQELGAEQTDEVFIMDNFRKKETGDSKKDMLFYISEVRVSNAAAEKIFSIKVNEPLKWKGLRFYQNSWDFQVMDFSFRFKGKTYALGQDKEMDLTDAQGNQFFFVPDTVREDKLVYKWHLEDEEEQILEQGVFTSQDLSEDHPLVKKWGFTILKEEFLYVSQFQVSYKPFLILPALGAFAFLIAIVLQMWIIKKPREEAV